MLGVGYGISLIILGIVFIIFRHFLIGLISIVFAFVLVYNMNKGMTRSECKYSTIFCPKCGSENYLINNETIYEKPKIKTKVRMYFNPFAPIMYGEANEKIVKKGGICNSTKLICRDCGHIIR